MSDILEIPSSNVSYLRWNSLEKLTPKHISSSEEGYIAILYPTRLLIGVIGCEPLHENKKYILNEEKVDIDFGFEHIFEIADLDFKKSIDDHLIEESVVFNFMLDVNYTLLPESGKLLENFCNMEWSPMNVYANKSFLALSRFDGRIVILGQNKVTNFWGKEFDITDLYFRYYKENLLENTVENGIVNCKDAVEYIKLKNDTKLLDFSWSMLVRQFKSEYYYMFVTVTASGIITIWRIIADQKGVRCDHLHSERLQLKGIKPLSVKFCDISETMFLLTIVDSRDLVTSFPFYIVADEKINVRTFSAPFIVYQQMRHCQQTKIHWSMKLSQLLIGFEWKLLIVKIAHVGNGVFDTESSILYLPSNSEISGLYVKEMVAYVTSADGFFFGIKLSLTITSLELNQIIFKNAEFNGNNEFYDVFVSPNCVHLGFLKISVDSVSRPIKCESSVVMVSLMSETQALNVLMDDNIPFSRKLDAIEEMKHLYSNKRHHLGESLKKIGNSDIQWDDSTLHRLQFVRYICILFGYKLTQSADGPDDLSKIRKLEFIIILKNISYWLEGFCELNNDEISRDDCAFVLRLAGKLSLAQGHHMGETIEMADNKAVTVLKNRFNVDDLTIQQCKDVTEDSLCPTCSEKCEFNIFSIKCSKEHKFQRCCKSLEICKKDRKVCHMCGAAEKLVEMRDLSSWRLEIVNSNCPLCDSKLLSVPL